MTPPIVVKQPRAYSPTQFQRTFHKHWARWWGAALAALLLIQLVGQGHL